VTLVAVRYPYSSGCYEIDGAKVIALGGATRRGPATLGVWRSTLDVLRREHRRRPFDVVHAFWATESGLLGALAGRLLRIPTLVSLAGGELVALPEIGYGDQRAPWERLKVRASLRLASLVSAGSNLLLQLAERHVGRPKLRRAPLGVDLELFHPAEGPQSAPLLHVGTLTPVKDQATLLRALKRLPEVRLDIVGDGPLRPQLQQLARELGIEQAVRFCGDIDHAALPVVYQRASAFVISSRHEAQGMVAIEAAACGLPVVGTRVGVVPELTDADAVVGCGSAEELAEAIAISLRDAPRRGADALARASSEYALECCTNRFRELYAEL
jgi:glycosyltransferase involved in cell wall biosynthesis